MFTKVSSVGPMIIFIGMMISLALISDAKPKPKPVDPAHFRVCVQSASEGTACSARLWSMADAQMIEQMFLQAPIPCQYGVSFQDITKDPDPVVPHEQDHSNETKVRWQ